MYKRTAGILMLVQGNVTWARYFCWERSTTLCTHKLASRALVNVKCGGKETEGEEEEKRRVQLSWGWRQTVK